MIKKRGKSEGIALRASSFCLLFFRFYSIFWLLQKKKILRKQRPFYILHSQLCPVS